jgi:hypothetical protein
VNREIPSFLFNSSGDCWRTPNPEDGNYWREGAIEKMETVVEKKGYIDCVSLH